jgi:hypothetical protein
VLEGPNIRCLVAVITQPGRRDGWHVGGHRILMVRLEIEYREYMIVVSYFCLNIIISIKESNLLYYHCISSHHTHCKTNKPYIHSTYPPTISSTINIPHIQPPTGTPNHQNASSLKILPPNLRRLPRCVPSPLSLLLQPLTRIPSGRHSIHHRRRNKRRRSRRRRTNTMARPTRTRTKCALGWCEFTEHERGDALRRFFVYI